MTNPYTLEEMLDQVGALAGDLRALVGPVVVQVQALLSEPSWAGVSRLYLIGNGDSHHAALAAELAMESLADLPCEPLSALRFLRYGAPWGRKTAVPEGTAVIGISASGGNQLVIQALGQAGEHGARTVAITTTPHSPITHAADHVLTLPLLGARPSPGIRTYQANLLGLLLIAIGLGRLRGRYTPEQAADLCQEVLAVAEAIDTTTATIRERCEHLAARVADAPVMIMMGSGPGYGTALFAAAKVIEASGVFAAGQDLEEWDHVEVLAYPRDMPTFVIAAPGRSRDRALAVATRARAFGRTVIVVADAADRDLADAADVVLPVYGAVREEFSPLLYHLFAGYLACFVAQRLNRLPFATNRH
jgi:glucosamine--fructose-6-phosphate aminotransferase (isomerizing)